MAAFLSMRLLTASARAWRYDQAHRCSAAGKHILPGVLLCAVLAWVACLAHNAEEQLLGRVWLDRLVLAILTGAAVRTVWRPGERWAPGIAFAAKILLEVAVVLLGASLSGQALAAFGPGLLVGIAAVVILGLAAGYGIGRVLGLPPRLALLVACGNAICGNSAIAAAAPVLGADAREVAIAIAFSAILGVVLVLVLPAMLPLFSLSDTQYGLLAGLTVYAVPQVVAVTTSAGALPLQVGTTAKLARVLMLAPVLVGLALTARWLDLDGAGKLRGAQAAVVLPRTRQAVPWFVLGFLVLAALRSATPIPDAVLWSCAEAANALTLLAMAGLGLGADLRATADAGARTAFAAAAALAAMAGAAAALIWMLGVA